ncbi:MAG TPA: multiheme c-type cytochrome [Xanthomonadaceae bacterium]|nr:multiheme c-type cytochrome [Xanthomonadaceae bacterium]
MDVPLLRRSLLVLGLSFAVPALVLAPYLLAETEFENNFVSSHQCAICHDSVFDAWYDTGHRKMMRPASDIEATHAQWGTHGQAPAFAQSEVAWIIGSKWEQQFMGQDGDHETLLPGAWSMIDEKWAMVGWDGWQFPEPLKRCHGCHTVGLDVESGTFVEPGIGCESCHGPGEGHGLVHGSGGMQHGLDADICGQCHARGFSVTGEYFYPVAFLPGDKLTDHFRLVEPDYLQNSSQWWGTGRERDRHQQFQTWRRGGHADALLTLGNGYDGRFGEVSEDCFTCHSAEYAVYGDLARAKFEAPKLGITCAVCHNVHGNLESARTACADCHSDGPFHHREVAMHEHVPCPESAAVTCVDCHMPITVRIAGALRLRSHAPGITEPADAAHFNAPSSCANGGCHQTASPEWLQAQFDRFYRAPLQAAADGSGS